MAERQINIFGETEEIQTGVQTIFGECLHIVMKNRSGASARGQLGKLRKQFNDEAIINAIKKSKHADDPLNMARKLLNGRKKTTGGREAFLNE